MTESSILKRAVGKRIKLYGGAGSSDEGVLEATDGHWVLLRKDNGEELYFSSSLIRLIKVIERDPPVIR